MNATIPRTTYHEDSVGFGNIGMMGQGSARIPQSFWMGQTVNQLFLIISCLLVIIGLSFDVADGQIMTETPEAWTDGGIPDGTGQPGRTRQRTRTGCDVRDIRWGKHGNVERIVFEMYEEWQSDKPLSQPQAFEVDYETHPYRLIVKLEGTWSVSAAVQAPRTNQLISGIHRIPSPVRSGQMFSIILKKPVSYKAFTLGDPARVVIDISEQKESVPGKVLYSLRTPSYRDTTYRLWETLMTIKKALSTATGGEAQIVQSRSGTFLVEEGLYPTREEAEEQRKALMKVGYRLLVEKRAPAEIPEALF